LYLILFESGGPGGFDGRLCLAVNPLSLVFLSQCLNRDESDGLRRLYPVCACSSLIRRNSRVTDLFNRLKKGGRMRTDECF
jgi:hypothetical protein